MAVTETLLTADIKAHIRAETEARLAELEARLQQPEERLKQDRSG